MSLYGADLSRSNRLGSLVKGRVLSPEDIGDVYQGGDFASDSRKKRLRRLVTRHVSEWSDQVDWIRALSDGEDWRSKAKEFKALLKKSGMFKDALGTVLPQIWLNKTLQNASVSISVRPRLGMGRYGIFTPSTFFGGLPTGHLAAFKRLVRS